MRILTLIILMATSFTVWAQESQPQVGKHVAGNLDVASVIMSLLLVLILIIACAFVLRKFQPKQGNVSGMKVVTSLHVGAKERLVVVEVDDKQLLLGVTAQQITHLHTLDKPLEVTKPLTMDLGQNIVKLLKNNDK